MAGHWHDNCFTFAAGQILGIGAETSTTAYENYGPIVSLKEKASFMVEIRSDKRSSFAHETVSLQIADHDLDFTKASNLARARAREINKDAMMLAWFNRRSKKGFPDYDCGAGNTPPWRVFAEARGANLTVDVNDGEYIFMYRRF